MDSDRVEHDPDNSRYVLKRGEEVIGETVYLVREDGTIDFQHTEIDPERQEKGLGSKLVRAALDDVRSGSTARVAATCPFTRHFIETHPEYEDLRTR